MRSRLCTYTVATGEIETVLETPLHIEAPNWHPSGTLIVNGNGRLHAVDPGNPRLAEIDTGSHNRLNNDHGVSRDGRTLFFSDKVECGASCIYAQGWTGVPAATRVSAYTPNWWHGVSPDGKTIAYAAAKSDRVVGVYVSAVDGSGERPLSSGFDHADGPDFSACGGWVWFNGERDGRVDIWRVRPDGSDLEQMTFGPSADWFPHPSPAGDLVVFLAYPPGTRGHPPGFDVALCGMPGGGGQVETWLNLHGGQGTINAPSWRADGGAFAFVGYVE